MKRLVFTAMFFAVSIVFAIAQENSIKRIPTIGKDANQEQYVTYERGVWFAAEVLGGMSTYLHGHNMGVGEIDLTIGYRFNQFLKIGAGLGVRCYIDQKNNRRHDSPVGMPIFISARGNMIPGTYRKSVPYWGAEIGGSVRDGFMFRPTIGVRIGEPRQALILGFSYMGQNIAGYNKEHLNTNRFTNFICLRAGYEF